MLTVEKVDRSNAEKEVVEKAEKRVLDKVLACRFIAASDKTRFGNVTVYLENEYVAGVDKFPKDVTAAYRFLENWKQTITPTGTLTNDGVSFAQYTGDEGTRTPRNPSKIRCYDCGVFGHKRKEGKCKPEDIEKWKNRHRTHIPSSSTGTANHMSRGDGDESSSDGDEYRVHVTMCMSDDEVLRNNEGRVTNKDGDVHTVMTHSFNTKREYVIPHNSVGLDSMSSVDVFGNKRMLTNIRTVNSQMRIVCNAGEVVVTKMGDLAGYGPVWYHPGAISNILSLSNVQKLYKATYDSEAGDFFTLHRSDGTTRTFEPTKKGLYAS